MATQHLRITQFGGSPGRSRLLPSPGRGVDAGALQLVAVTLIVVGALGGLSRIKWPRFIRFSAVTVALMVGTVVGLKVVMGLAISQEYVGYESLVQRTPLLEDVRVREADQVPPGLSPKQRAADRLALIRDRGWIRVGYLEGRLPYAFRNEDGVVVGLDAELARGVATDLGVGVEFVRLSLEDAFAPLRSGSVDILMSGMVMEPNRTRFVQFSVPYMDITAALAVPDHLRHEFSSLPDLRSRHGVRIGVVPSVRYERDLARYLPDAELVPMTDPRPFFRGEMEVDAILLSAQEAAAWTLVYPAYAVAVPFPDWRAPVGAAMDLAPSTLNGFVNTWLELATRDGTVDRYFSYWIMGEEPPERHAPRWSIMRDVLGWAAGADGSDSRPDSDSAEADPDLTP